MTTITQTDCEAANMAILSARHFNPMGVMLGGFGDHLPKCKRDEILARRKRIRHLFIEHAGVLVLDPAAMILGSLSGELIRSQAATDLFNSAASRADFAVDFAHHISPAAKPGGPPCPIREMMGSVPMFGLTTFIMPEYGELGFPSNPDAVTGSEQTFMDTFRKWAASWRRDQHPGRAYRELLSQEGRHATIRGTGFDSPGVGHPNRAAGNPRVKQRGAEPQAGDGPSPMGEPVARDEGSRRAG